MWQEGQEGNEDLFDDVPESFVRCALHQARIIRERWKFWSGTVPTDVSIRLHRLESILSINQEKQAIVEDHQIQIQSSQPVHIKYPTIERYYTEPEQNIIIQGPDVRRLVKQKRRVHFWCCH